jgi:radical SAM superfamily enzyme YgiQ (UPF0313 family)
VLTSCRWQSHRLVISFKPGCLTFSLEKKDSVTVYSFDHAGRLWTSLEEGKSFRHGLDSRVLARWKDNTGRAQRRWLTEGEACGIESRARQLVVDVLTGITTGTLDLNPTLSDVDLNRLKKTAAFTNEMQKIDRQEYNRIYRPIGILPPDQYMSVVLQLTEGCSFNSCTFCGLYRGQEFRIKSLEEFHQHALDVRDYLKEGISLRKTIFLGGANALVLPQEKLRPYLEIIGQAFNVQALGGIFAFLDGFSGEKKSLSDYQEMADLGMDTVFIGLESGCDDLLKYLKKPASSDQVLETVKTLKAAGISAAVIILLGAGGQIYHDRHVQETVRVLNEMKLDGSDMVYFSRMVSSTDAPYASLVQEKHLMALTESEQNMQWHAIESQLTFDEITGMPSISVYDIRDFVY